MGLRPELECGEMDVRRSVLVVGVLCVGQNLIKKSGEIVSSWHVRPRRCEESNGRKGEHGGYIRATRREVLELA